jgi:hypothetical protein
VATITRTFSRDDIVTWTSSAAGSAKTKTGKVVRVVPAGAMPRMNEVADLYDATNNYGGGSARDHVSYLVLVPGATERSRQKLYWPVASLLRPAKVPSKRVTARKTT